jgi:hypothetical protein
MELTGASYLYTLATVSITYVGFTALIAILRQTLGGEVSELDIFVTRTFIQLGLLATGASLLAPLLALSGMDQALVWRLASVIVAPVLGVWTVTFPWRRRAASTFPIPPRIWALLGVLAAGSVTLVGNAVKPWGALSPMLYAAGVSTILFSGTLLFVSAIRFLVMRTPDQEQAQPKA